MDGGTDIRTDIHPCVLQDIIPFGSAAQKGSISKIEVSKIQFVGVKSP